MTSCIFRDYFTDPLFLSGLDSAAILNRAAILVEAGWTQGAGARDENGQPIALLSPRAIRFCAIGALMRATVDYLIDNKILPEDSRGKGIVNHPATCDIVDFVLVSVRRGCPEVPEMTKRWLLSKSSFYPNCHAQSLIAVWNDNLASQADVVRMLRRASDYASGQIECYGRSGSLAAVPIGPDLDPSVPDPTFLSASEMLKLSPARRKSADLSALFPKIDTRVRDEYPKTYPQRVKELTDA